MFFNHLITLSKELILQTKRINDDNKIISLKYSLISIIFLIIDC